MATRTMPITFTRKKAQPHQGYDVDSAIASLKRVASKKHRDSLARFAIPSEKAFGVPVGKIQQLAKTLKRGSEPTQHHRLAGALWDTGWYEARLLAAFLDDPAMVTPSQMDRWCRDFESWADCDTVCFHLFDRTPYAFAKVEKWSTRKGEFARRAAFALLASVALHDKQADDESFARCLPLIERAATDERNFVKKAVSWALRSVGRRSPELRKAAASLAERLAESDDAASRWIGKDALRDFAKTKGRSGSRKKG